MKHLTKFSSIVITLLVLFQACGNEETNNLDIEGIYKGTLTGSLTHGTPGNSESTAATSEITITGENEIQVHCYSEGFDTTFAMNYYHHHNDSAYVFHTGDDFEEMYGHLLRDGHMGGMMDNMHVVETEWMHHRDEEHDEGDEHFQGFDMTTHSFSYTFQMNKSDSSVDLHFQGIKQ